MSFTHTRLRDLLFGTPSVNPSIREVASHAELGAVFEAENPTFSARLPGDALETHPLVQSQLHNPFYGVSPLRVSRLLRAGKLDPEQEKQARGWLDQYQKLTGESVYDARNHEPVESDPEACPYHLAGPYR